MTTILGACSAIVVTMTVLQCLLIPIPGNCQATVEFAHSSYMFPEGIRGEVCLTITNAITLDHSVTYNTGIRLGSCSPLRCGQSGLQSSCYCDRICDDIGLQDCCYNVRNSCPGHVEQPALPPSLESSSPISAGEYEISATSVSFPVGASQGHMECVTLTFFQDDNIEGIECLALYIRNAILYFVPVCTFDSGVVIGFDTTSYNITEPGIVQVGVVLTGNISDSFAITVTVEAVYETATAGVDYVGVPINLTFTDETTKFVNITILDDDLAERLEVIQLNLSTQSNVTESEIYVTTATVDISITDDDVAEFRFTQSSYNVGESDGMVNICLELITSVLSEDKTIRLVNSEGNGVTATNGDDFINTRNLTFTSGTGPSDRGSVMCIDISIVNDFLVEGTEKFVLCALDENNMPGDYSACTDIFIEDDDVAVLQFSQESYNVDESNGEACVCIELVSGELAIDVIIEVSSEEDTMFASGSGSAQLTTEVSTYVFFRGTQPTGIGAQKCRKISVGDRYLSMEPTNICGYTSMNSSINILILNDGCATISIGDNNVEGSACNVLDFVPFADVKAFPGFEELDRSKPDSFSDPIYIPGGLLFGDEAVTTAYVNENGVISFNEPWQYSYPNRYPTNYFYTRSGQSVAPFWSDNDIRRAGTVLYATYNDEEDTNKAGRILLAEVNNYIQARYTDEPFKGGWLLVAHWNNVHPSPHGDNNQGDFGTEELEKTNNYQGVIVTDGLSTYIIFTYICGEMQWSSLGTNNPAVVGYNAGNGHFYNHPLSGFSSIGESISCTIESRTRSKRQTVMQTTNSLDMPLPVSQTLKMNIERCRQAFDRDKPNFAVVKLDAVVSQLEPCPCTLNQAKNDVGRFLKFSDNPLSQCYLSTPIDFSLIVRSATLTQQCCYNPTNGALQTSVEEGFFGTMLLHHPVLDRDNYELTDESFRRACCSFGNDMSCNEFVRKRPINDCTGYQPPNIATGSGDPHYTTFDGQYYTINGFGEFVLVEAYLQGSTKPVFTLQGRLGMVSFWRVTTHLALSYGSDSVAFHFGMAPGFRVFRTKPGPVEEITDQIKTTGEVWYDPTQEAALVRKGNELRAIFFQSRIVVIAQVNPVGNEYYMNFRIQVPQSYSGNLRGMLGNFDGDPTNDFYRRGETSPLPNTISERDLFEEFKTWQASQSESLFYYAGQSRKRQAGGTYDDFQNLNFVPIFSDELNFTDEQRMICEDNPQCLFDLAITEETTFAMETLEQEKVANTTTKTLQNFPPNISAETFFRVNIGRESVYSLTVVDPGDNVTLSVQGEPPQDSILKTLDDGEYVFSWSLSETTTEPLVFIATDSSGASSTFIPVVEICACANEGNCTRDGLLTMNSTVVLNCICHEAFSGTFCEEDHNGCSEIQCFEGVECMDVPAPGVGAVCGPCPFGYTGDSFKCYDIDECAQNATLCGQLCVNTDGSYFCSCEDGYELVEGTTQCRDIDECAGINPCQQLCINTEGSFSCNCTEGFTLAPDERNCTADDPCQSSTCSHICGVINGTEQCFCPIGFELSTPGGTQCTDRDECLNDPCDQQCINTHGSFVCSCMDGYELQTNQITCKDIDECLVAALISVDLCENDTNTQCINIDGSHECVCVPGFERVNGTCEVIENEAPPPTQVLIPNIGIENSVNFTARALTLETFTPSKLQSFRDITSSLLNDFCSNTRCTLILVNQESQDVSNLTVLPSNIAIPTSQISENENGQLQIVFYVQIEKDFLLGDQLQVAVQKGLEEYRTAGFLPGANISLPEFVNLTEGEEVEVCVTVNDDEQPLQRDILLSFSVIPNSMLSSAGDVTLVNTSIAVPPGVSEACLQLLVADDEIVEGEETFTLTVEAADPSDTVNGNVPITISDNDGATLSVNQSVNVMEGEIQEICILADCNSQSCEREVPITLLLLFNCTTCDTGDFNATDLPLEIPIGPAQACFQFEAVDDEIVESDEIVSLIIDTLNPYDIVVDENSTIIISDNDGVEITFYDNATVIISEGEMFDVCLNISELSEERERDVVVYIIFISPITSSYSTADGDLTAENVSITITPGMSEACFEILAVDDEIVENDEEFVVTAEADNPNDIVTGNVSINILDNDGAILKVKGSINLTEREVREICVEIEQTLERTVPLSFSFILDSVTSGDFNVINQPAEIPIGASEACFQLEAVDDDIIEAEEEFTLVTETIHPNDTADGSTRVVITDNDYVDIDFNGTRVVTEGSVLDICVPFSDQRERDVVISFTFTPISLTSADSDITIVNKTTLIPPGLSEACIQLLAVNDEIVEDDEAFILTIESELPQDRVNGSVSVIISDNDGVSIAVNEPVNMTEGDVQEVCVTIESTEQSRERLIPISLTFIPKTSTTNRGDVNITNSVIEIPIGESEACIHLGAVDDNIVENEEEFILAVRAININDVLDRNTTLFISDNDGVELKINQSITIIEGGIQEICVATHDPELALERDIPFLIIAHGNNTFGDGDDFQLMNANDSTVDVISRGQDKTCFELMANDDDIIEDDELFTIVVEAIHPNDRGTNTTVTISDNDGAHMSLVYPILDVTESEQFNICVKLVNNSDRLQRTVPITLDFGDADDIRATTGYYEFKPDAKPLYCFNLTAIDDDYIESIEYHEVLLKTVKQLDSIDVKETIVTIFDNDNLPSEVDVNTVTVLVTLKDLNTITFDADKQQLFKETTAQSINEYCDTNENCQLINFMANRRKRQADVSVRVTADDIILRDIRNSNQNGVEFSMFVMTSDGSSVLSASTLINTIEASADAFNQNGFSTPSTSLLYTQSTSNLSGGIIAAIVIAVVVVIATVIITATIIIILYRKHTRLRKKSVLPNVYIEQTSMSIMNVGAKLDGEADKDNIQEHEMCDVDDEKKKEQED